MKKLRFKNRSGTLYFGIDGKFKSSKLKYTNINKNILIGRFKQGKLDTELGFDCTSSSMRIEDLLNKVMIEKNKHLKHKTLLAYSSAIKNHILPRFKNKVVTEIKPIHIKEFQDSLLDKGFNKSTLCLSRVLLKEVFDIAILSEVVVSNPVMMVRLPRMKTRKVKKKPFSLNEVDEILLSSPSMLKNFLGISFFTGLRSGEVLGLTWEDIDFITDTISVNKTIASGLINSPKTFASFRDIEMIDKAKEFFLSQRLETGLQNSYLFLSQKGKYHNSTHTFTHQYKAVLEMLGIEYRSLHSTRHTFASMMLNNSIEPLWVSKTLGHENLDITLKVYAHYMPKQAKMSIEFLEKRYKNGTSDI